MPSKKSVGLALRLARRKTEMSQDDFTDVSSRTFVSSIERGLKSPTVQKLSELAGAMQLDAAVVVLVASLLEEDDPEEGLQRICAEAWEVLSGA
jgi:transcriptional regulator with XRE-family HTH domain